MATGPQDGTPPAVPDPPPAGPGGLGRRAARGAAVTLGGQAVRIVVQLLSVTVLARLLTPGDYGLLAMVVVIVGVGEIFRDFGLSSAAVQAKTLSVAQRDNLFWINTGIGVALAALVAASAGLVAALYGRPELEGIARALALTFVLNGLATQYRADLLRRLRFGAVALAEVLAPALALAVAATVAVSGGGYWALVAQNLTQAVTLLLAMAVAARWLPGRVRRDVPMRGLLRFGGRLVGTQLIGYASNNVDTLVIGLRFGAGPLGLYNRAFQLLMTPLNQLRAPMTTVALPILSRLQDDQPRYSEFVRRGQVALGYSLVTSLAVVVAAADPVVELVLGERWAAVAPLLRLLAVAGMLQTLSYVGYWVYLSRDLTRDLLHYTMLTSAIKVACVLVGSWWGVVGVAAGYAVAPALAWPLSLWWLSRRTALPTRALFLGALRILGVSAFIGMSAASAVVLLDSTPALMRITGAGLGGAVAYALAALVPAVRRDMGAMVHLVRLARERRGP